MNEIYIVDGQKYDVNPERKDEFLQKFPNAVLFEEPGKTTPTTPGAVVEDTAAPDIPNTELQSENTSLDLPDPEELTPEEKRNVPFGTAQYLHRNNKKFTKKNVEEAQAKLLADANKTFFAPASLTISIICLLVVPLTIESSTSKTFFPSNSKSSNKF